MRYDTATMQQQHQKLRRLVSARAANVALLSVS